MYFRRNKVFHARFTKDAAEDIKSLPKNVRNCLKEKLEKIVVVNPTNCSEELTGPLVGFRSYHLDDYRVVYKIYDSRKIIVVVGIGKKNADHYSEIYKNLENMARAGKLAESVLANIQMLRPS
jgi:addiction module RelE/StbE family toxin